MGGSARCAFPPARIVIGISTLALPSCAVLSTIASLVRVCFSPVARVVSSGGFPVRRNYDIGWTTGTITC